MPLASTIFADSTNALNGNSIFFEVTSTGSLTYVDYTGTFSTGNLTYVHPEGIEGTFVDNEWPEHTTIRVQENGAIEISTPNFGYETTGNFVVNFRYPSKDRKHKIRSNSLFKVSTRSKIRNIALTGAELKARNTLRDLITEKEWRRYITNGFIMARGRSGKFYQIFIDRSHLVVWENNRKVQELCIYTDYSCPPTDHVLTIKTMVEIDEQAVWAGSNLRPVQNAGNQ